MTRFNQDYQDIKSVILEDINTLPVFLDRDIWIYERGDVFVSRCKVDMYNKKNVIVLILWDDFELCYYHKLRVKSYGKRWVLFLNNAPTKEQINNISWANNNSIFSRFKKKGTK